MSFTLAGIRDRILIDKLDDEDFDPNVVDNFINDTIRDIYLQYELSFMEKIYSGTLPAGVTLFSLPLDVSTMQSQIITSPEGEQKDISDNYIQFREFNKLYPTPLNNQPGYPAFWTSFGGKMLLNRPTDKDYKLDIFYVKKPDTLLNDNDIPDLPYELEELIVLGAFSRVQYREGDSDEAIYTDRKYTEMLQRMASRYGYRTSNTVPRMRNRQRI